MKLKCILKEEVNSIICIFFVYTNDNGGVANPACGSGYSVPIKKGLSFFCHPSLYGRYVTIRSLKRNNGLLVCEVEVYSERRGKLHNLYFLCLYQ